MRAVPVMVGVAFAALALGACSSSAENAAPAPTTAAGRAPATTLPLTGDGTEAVAAYRTFLTTQAAILVRETERFAAAVKAGDVAAAQALFPVARAPYERIRPIAEELDDLDTRIDARDGDVPADEWGGFHKIERQLWEDNNTEGMTPVADRLVADVTRLQTLVARVELGPHVIANGAIALLNQAGTSKVTGEEDRYAHTDLYDLDANIHGAQAAFTVVAPIVAKHNAELGAQLANEFAAVRAALAAHRRGDGYVSYTDLSDRETRALGTQIDALADTLSAVPPLLGVVR